VYRRDRGDGPHGRARGGHRVGRQRPVEDEDGGRDQAVLRFARPSAGTTGARVALRASLGSQAVMSIDPLTGTPSQLVRLDGALSGPATGGRTTIAMNYVRAHDAALGLTGADLDGLALAQNETTNRGLTVMRWQQRYLGIPAFDNDLRVAVDRAGRVISVGGSPMHALSVPSVAPALGAAAAVTALASNVGARRTAAITSGPTGARQDTRFADGTQARLVLFGTAGGARLAWHVTFRAAETADYDAVVDATSGAVLYRQNLVKFAANAHVFPNFPGAVGPANALRRVDLQALGYVPTGARTLNGKFAHTYVDANGNLVDDPDPALPNNSEEVPNSAGTNFDYPFVNFPNPSPRCEPTALCSWDSQIPTSWQTNKFQDAVQAHWFVGNYHDHLFAPPIGFDNASGNFEVGGTGGDDPVELNADNGAATDPNGGPDPNHVDNAFMITLPDGQPPSMAMFLNDFDAPGLEELFRDNNNGDDAATVYHEYTHGLSNRLITNADGTGAVSSPEAGAMGEAWSDWYAFDFLARQNLDPDNLAVPGEEDLGKYSDATPHSTRFQALDCPVGIVDPACPGGFDTVAGGFTYGDFGHVFTGPEVHSDGEIWGETLWDLRQQFVARFGEETGSDTAEALVTDAMRLSPPEPSMLDMRNAIMAADVADFGGADTNTLWRIFAHRGMGYFAAAFGGDDVAPVESFNLPPAAGGAKGAISGAVTDAETGLPLSGVKVAFSGHATAPGFPEFLAGTTGATGSFSVTGVPVGTYPKFSFEKPGFDRVVVPDVAISQDTPAVRSAALQRDWASKAGGATVTQTEPSPESDCDANFLIDQTAAGWETFQDGDPTVGPSATVTLPATVNVDRFLMDPSNTCGDGASASTAAFRLETSTDGITFRVAKAGTFTAADRNRLNTVTPDGTSGRAVRFVRLTLLSAQNEGPGFSGNSFVDFTELEVIGGPPNALPSGRLVPSATVVRPGQAVAFDASSFRDPDSRITGYDWDFDGNGTTDRHTAGPVTSFAYGGAGTFTARVHANDFRGGFGAAAATVRVVPAPAVVAPLPRLSLSRTGTRGRVAFRVTCAARCRVTARLTISRSLARRLHLRSRTVGTLTRTVTGTRRLTLRVRLSARARRAARRAGLKTVRATLTTRATYADGRSTRSSRKVRIRLR
jgi:hypothetical protein